METKKGDQRFFRCEYTQKWQTGEVFELVLWTSNNRSKEITLFIQRCHFILEGRLGMHHTDNFILRE